MCHICCFLSLGVEIVLFKPLINKLQSLPTRNGYLHDRYVALWNIATCYVRTGPCSKQFFGGPCYKNLLLGIASQ